MLAAYFMVSKKVLTYPFGIGENMSKIIFADENFRVERERRLNGTPFLECTLFCSLFSCVLPLSPRLYGTHGLNNSLFLLACLTEAARHNAVHVQRAHSALTPTKHPGCSQTFIVAKVSQICLCTLHAVHMRIFFTISADYTSFCPTNALWARPNWVVCSEKSTRHVYMFFKWPWTFFSWTQSDSSWSARLRPFTILWYLHKINKYPSYFGRKTSLRVSVSGEKTPFSVLYLICMCFHVDAFRVQTMLSLHIHTILVYLWIRMRSCSVLIPSFNAFHELLSNAICPSIYRYRLDMMAKGIVERASGREEMKRSRYKTNMGDRSKQTKSLPMPFIRGSVAGMLHDDSTITNFMNISNQRFLLIFVQRGWFNYQQWSNLALIITSRSM